MEVRLSLHAQAGDVAGLAMMGKIYHYIALRPGRVVLIRSEAQAINRFTPDRMREEALDGADTTASELWLRMQVRDGQVAFDYAETQGQWRHLGDAYPLTCGGWVGASPGIFCLNTSGRWGGWADVAYVRVKEK